MRWPAALIVTDCTFTANAAPWNATAGLDHLHYSSGGAIYVDRTIALVYYSLFRENTAAGHGGAIALVQARRRPRGFSTVSREVFRSGSSARRETSARPVAVDGFLRIRGNVLNSSLIRLIFSFINFY